jgi:hypothetical protein
MAQPQKIEITYKSIPKICSVCVQLSRLRSIFISIYTICRQSWLKSTTHVSKAVVDLKSDSSYALKGRDAHHRFCSLYVSLRGLHLLRKIELSDVTFLFSRSPMYLWRNFVASEDGIGSGLALCPTVAGTRTNQKKNSTFSNSWTNQG